MFCFKSAVNTFCHINSDFRLKGGKDNRDIVDRNSSQKLSKEEIEAMRDSGTSGQAVMAALIENSDTFAKKTKFSQADILFLKHASRIFRQSSNPVCGLSLMEQVRLCAVWPTKNCGGFFSGERFKKHEIDHLFGGHFHIFFIVWVVI